MSRFADLPASLKSKHQGRTIIYETPSSRYHYFRGQATASFSFWLHIIIDTAENTTCRMPDITTEKRVRLYSNKGKLIDKLPDSALRLLKNHLEGELR